MTTKKKIKRVKAGPDLASSTTGSKTTAPKKKAATKAKKAAPKKSAAEKKVKKFKPGAELAKTKSGK